MLESCCRQEGVRERKGGGPEWHGELFPTCKAFVPEKLEDSTRLYLSESCRRGPKAWVMGKVINYRRFNETHFPRSGWRRCIGDRHQSNIKRLEAS